MKTAVWVCALRAEEQNHPKPLFSDPYSSIITGSLGNDVIELMQSRRSDPKKAQIPYAVVRTRFFDEFIEGQLGQGRVQVVSVGCGLDTRPWRIPWPDGTAYFELDRNQVHALKGKKLSGHAPKCRLMPVPCEIGRDDIGSLLRNAGLEEDRPVLWLLEGISMYLDLSVFQDLMQQIDRLSPPGSSLVCDVFNTQVMLDPKLSRLLTGLERDGSPIKGGIDEPNFLLAGWKSTTVQPGEEAASYGRWPLSVPPDGDQAPRAFFATYVKA